MTSDDVVVHAWYASIKARDVQKNDYTISREQKMYYSSLTSVVALLIINALTNAVPLSRRNLESDEESTRAAFRRELGDDLTTSTVIRNLGVCKW